MRAFGARARTRVGVLALLVVGVGLLLYPLHVDAYHLSVLRDALVFGVFALSLDYLWGKTGILSFGHATFFGLGAYGMAIATIKLGLPATLGSPLGLLAGVLLAAAVAVVVGYFLIFGGVRGAYFTIVTLALTTIAQHVAIGWSAVTGGDSGLIGVPPLTIGVAGVEYGFTGLPLYYLVLGIATAALVTLWIACRGRYGKVLLAIQDNELRARALGHDTAAHLFGVFVLSAMLAALAGAVYVTSTGFVAPDMIGLLLSTEVIMWVAVGGRGTFIGSFVGTFVVMRLQQVVSSVDTKLWPLFLGAFFVSMVFLFPDGILSVARWLRGARRHGTSAP